MNIREKLLKVQVELKTPKSQTNTFGKYKYRNCEDIQEAVKPLLKEVNATLIISDDIVLIGARYYIKATATFYDCEEQSELSNTAYAREEETKKGMDASQITGCASSYARKYALNGLFAIDDSKDADTNEHHDQTNQKEETKNKDTKRYCCENCGTEFLPFKWKEKDYTAKEAYDIAKSKGNKVGDGMALCRKCIPVLRNESDRSNYRNCEDIQEKAFYD